MKTNINNYIEGFNWEDVYVGQSMCCQITKNDFSNSYLGEIVEVIESSRGKHHDLKVEFKITENLTNRSLLPNKTTLTLTKHHCAMVNEEGTWCGFDVLGRVLIPIKRKDNKEEHQSFGKIAITKWTGNNSSFYGSHISHNGGITLKISKSSVERRYGSDHYFADDTIVEVDMSYFQWVEAMTSAMNTEGVPCTLKRVGGEWISPAPIFNQRERFDSKFESEMKKMSDSIMKATEDAEKILSSGKAPNKGEKVLILDSLNSLRRDLSSNIPYMAKCFDEKMDEAVLDAKQEIDGFYETMVIKYGIEAINQIGLKAPALGEIEDKL